MNTINNQQINPGNRVDFSRIRRFAKGGVPKYQDAPGKLPYNWDWDGLNNAINNGGFGTATATSLGYNKTFTPQGDIKTVADLEKSQDYIDFTNYVKLNATTDPKVLEYLKNLDAKSRKTGATTGHLFDASGNLVQGWESIYDNLRTDGKYGAYHYSANKLQPTQPTVSTVTFQPLTTTNNNSVISGPLPTLEFKPLQFLPLFQKSAPNTGYLHQIYENNLDSINKLLDYELLKKTPETVAPWQNATISSNYIQAQEAKKQISENRALYLQLVNNTGDIAKANAAMLNYDMNVTNPALAQVNQNISDTITATTENANNIAFTNNLRETENSNYNTQNRIAKYNSDLTALSKAESKTASEAASFLNNRAAVIKENTMHNKQEELLYNTKAGNIMASFEGQLAYKEYLNSAIDAANNADLSSGITLLTIVSSMIQDASSTNGLELTDEELEVLNDPTSEKSDILEVIINHRADLDEMSNSAVSAWITSYNNYMKDADLRWSDAKYRILQKQAILGLGLHSHVSGSNDDSGIGLDYRTLFSGSLYKKGGKVEDRWSKYLQYRSKFNDTVQKALNHTEKIAQTKLARDLDALDRETLLLLRSVFK